MKTLRREELEGTRVLVRVPNWIGDAVMCLPALRELRRGLPQAELVLVARPWVRDILPADELRCQILSYDTSVQHKGFGGRRSLASELREERFSAAFLFQNAFDAALLAWLARIPIRAGYKRQGRGFLLTHPVPVPRRGEIPRHESHYYLELLRRLGLIPQYPEVQRILLPASESAHAAARVSLEELLRKELPRPGEGRLLVGISPGAAFGTAKRWPPQRFAQLLRRLGGELGATCLLFGSPQEKPLVESLLPEASRAAFSLAGKTTLAEFTRLIQGCDLYITNDTGTMHVAAGLGVPTLALFGPTDERRTRPLGPHTQLLIGNAFCRPCFLRHCPIDHRCMTSISVEDVFQAARSLLLRKQRETVVWQENPA